MHPSHSSTPYVAVSDFTQPSRASLRAVLGFHLLESAGQMLALWLSAAWLKLSLNYATLWWLVGGYAAWNVASWLWYRRDDVRVSSVSLFVPLLIEMLVLTSLLYLSGGFTNPFVSLYLVPVALAATMLRPSLAIPLGIVSIVLYTLLTQWYVPLDAVQGTHGAHSAHAHHNHMQANSQHNQAQLLHFFGMWVNYVISAVVVMTFLGFLAQLSRKRAQQLAAAREKALRDQQVVAIGGVAASAAHSLSTPLSTVAMVLDELHHESDEHERSMLIDAAKQQIDACRTHLSELLRSAGKERLHQAKRLPAQDMLTRVVQAWRITRPNIQLTHDWHELNDASLMVDATLPHCINNLLDNAADASLDAEQNTVRIHAQQQEQQLLVHIDDRGDGRVRHQHQPPLSDKTQGHGAGLLLTQSNLERMGGALRFSQHESGCRATISLPLATQQHTPKASS